MMIVCRTCNKRFKRSNICNPKTLRVWNCPIKRCAGYGTIETINETLARNADAMKRAREVE